MDKPIIVSLTQIVYFRLESSLEVVLFITGEDYAYIHGRVIAYSHADKYLSNNLILHKIDIIDYRILTKEDLPLYIEFEYTSSLFTQLLLSSGEL